MSAETLLQELKLPVGAEIDEVEDAFLKTLMERLRTIAETFDEEEVRKEEAWLRAFHEDFFDFAHKWAQRETVKNKNIKEHPEAARLKKDALKILSDLQKNIIEFASAYMSISRYATLLRDEIREKEIKQRGAYKKIPWTSDMGMLLARKKKEQRQLLNWSKKMGKARLILETLEPDLDSILTNLDNVFGVGKGAPFQRSLFAALRMGDPARAKKVLHQIDEGRKKLTVDQKSAAQAKSDIRQAAQKIMATFQENEEFVKGPDGKFFLRPVETDRAYNSCIQDLKKILAFLNKYHLPYMQYKLESLYHLKEKLMVAGTPDSLMVLYKQLIKGIALPLEDIKSARSYEADTLQLAQYLLSTQFQEIPKILQRAHETVEEFRRSRNEFEDLKDMKLEEKPLGQENAGAQASA